jgi:Kef-type K+ transport system membrane component KefB
LCSILFFPYIGTNLNPQKLLKIGWVILVLIIINIGLNSLFVLHTAIKNFIALIKKKLMANKVKNIDD